MAKSQRYAPMLTATKNNEMGLLLAIERWLMAKGGCYCGKGTMASLACKLKVAFMASKLKLETIVEESEPKWVRQGGGGPLRRE